MGTDHAAKGLDRRRWSPDDLLSELKRRGAGRLRRVAFRANRSTIWSLTQGGTVLNLHDAYRDAPDHVLSALATIASHDGGRTESLGQAAEQARNWQGLRTALDTARSRYDGRKRRDPGRRGAGTSCCGTVGQRMYLRALYRYLNQTRFAGALPQDLPVRLSSRMTTSLGHMLGGGHDGGPRYVVEIALNVDLMMAGNAVERIDTMLHEMAHAADYLLSGHRGHGASWRAWARRVGCRPEARCETDLPRRRGRAQAVTRVPPLPRCLLHGISRGSRTEP